MLELVDWPPLDSFLFSLTAVALWAALSLTLLRTLWLLLELELFELDCNWLTTPPPPPPIVPLVAMSVVVALVVMLLVVFWPKRGLAVADICLFCMHWTNDTIEIRKVKR